MKRHIIPHFVLALVLMLCSSVALAGVMTNGPQQGDLAGSPMLTAAQASEDVDFLLNHLEKIHPAPFRLAPRAAWIEEARGAASEPLTEAAFYSEILKLVAMAADGHMDAYPPATSNVRDAVPVKMILFPGGVYVGAAAETFLTLTGTEVIAVEGRPIAQALRALTPLVPSDNSWGRTELMEDYLRMPDLLEAVGIANGMPGFQLTVKDRSKTSIVTVDRDAFSDELPAGPPRRPLPAGWADARAKSGELPLWQRNLSRNFWYQPLPEADALYVQINRVAEDRTGEFAEFVESLPRPSQSGLSRLILDLRTNRGGDATIAQPLLHAIICDWDYLQPGTLFVITSKRTFSAAVHIAADLERNTHAIFIGEPAAAPPNHYADVKTVTLPHSRIEVEISSLYWQKSDPRDSRLAIHPDIPVPGTWRDFVEGRDAALEAIAALEPDDPRLARQRPPIFNWLRENQAGFAEDR